MRKNPPNSTCPRPGPIDNNPLVVSQPVGGGNKIPPLTAEGGKLRRSIGLVKGRDYQLLPQALWKALEQWYGGTPALPRQVIVPREGAEPELELYPLVLKVMRHQIPPRPPNQQQTWSDVVGGYGAAALGNCNRKYLEAHVNIMVCSFSWLWICATKCNTKEICGLFSCIFQACHRQASLRIFVLHLEAPS